MTRTAPQISIVIPARDEVIAIGPLVTEIGQVMAGESFEVIVIDDGSTDGTGAALADLAAQFDWLRGLRNDRAVGQSASIRAGVRAAQGALIVTLDGDGQNPPDQIPALLAPLRAPGSAALGLVQGQRVGRRDTLARRWASQAANAIRGALLHDGVRDSGCGLKAFRRAAYFDLPWFDHIHRFMPAMMLREGWGVATVPVTHRARSGGASKYSNLRRALVGIPDLLGAAWLIRRAARVPSPSVMPEAAEAPHTPQKGA
ncbi:MAG: glycosyltransferase family 2 protein [Rhodobacteraceae bacterium]|nr:glycosyltransferase family 2 protein [Paracoccaceae bacterium]